MFTLIFSIIFLISSGLIASKLYNKNKVHYFYFIMGIIYVYPFFSNYIEIFPKMTSLSYYPVIIFPFIFNKRLTKLPYFWSPFIIISLVGFIVNFQNAFLYLFGLFRYIYFFLILLLFLKTTLTKDETRKILIAFLAVGVIQFPVNILNMLYTHQFTTNLSFIDTGGGSFGHSTGGILGTYLVMCIFLVLLGINNIKNMRKLYLLFSFFGALSLTYSGGAITMLVILAPFILLGARFSVWRLIMGTLILVSAFGLFQYSHHLILKNISVQTISTLAESSDTGAYGLLRMKRLIPFLSLDKADKIGNVSIRNLGRRGAILASLAYANDEGTLLVGAGAGSLNRAGALTNMFDLSEYSAFSRVFKYNSDFTNSVAILLGEMGILGFFAISFFMYRLIAKKYKPFYNRILIYYLSIFTFIFILYSYYEHSLFAYQFLLFWSFIVMNLDNIFEIKGGKDAKIMVEHEGS